VVVCRAGGISEKNRQDKGKGEKSVGVVGGGGGLGTKNKVPGRKKAGRLVPHCMRSRRLPHQQLHGFEGRGRLTTMRNRPHAEVRGERVGDGKGTG